jgi:hypothetical protein
MEIKLQFLVLSLLAVLPLVVSMNYHLGEPHFYTEKDDKKPTVDINDLQEAIETLRKDKKQFSFEALKDTEVLTIRSVQVYLRGHMHKKETLNYSIIVDALKKLVVAMYTHGKVTYGSINIYEDDNVTVQVGIAAHESTGHA